jgi:guanylate kinase
MPPSLSVLEKRLKLRGSESKEKLSMRLEKAKKEIKKSEMFDHIIVNDSLDEACLDAKRLVLDFIKN